ncbi:MAG: type II toxin-antitoxin system death-on-curing family toxin [Sedimentisphaerales bacterium]|nr:type II toxin-antitoxin system death-on-curing family toxin [Sedimentisphaerales bacterium]
MAFELARKHMEFDEPIPDCSSRFPGILEGCLAVPFQQFFGHDLYPTLAAKTSILFYLMIKDHPFQDGNKRIAITALFVLLYLNGKWLQVDMTDLYHFTVRVAESKPEDKNLMVAAITGLVSTNMIDFPTESNSE